MSFAILWSVEKIIASDYSNGVYDRKKRSLRVKMKDSDSKVPDQKDLEKELNEYLGKKYGDRIRLVVPMLFPKPQTEEVSKEEKERGEEKKKIHFDLKPEELEAFLNDYIIRQDEAKEILATKICTQFNRIKFTEITKGR